MKNRLDSAGIRYQEQLGVVGGAFKENRKYGFYARLEDAQVLNWIYDVAFDRHGTQKQYTKSKFRSLIFQFVVNSNTMLIISDEKMTSEIYDLDESACNKRGPSFPIQSNSTGRYVCTQSRKHVTFDIFIRCYQPFTRSCRFRRNYQR